MTGDGKVPGATTTVALKKSIGRVIISINNDILEFLEELKKEKTGAQLSKRGVNIENSIKKRKTALALRRR